MSGVDPSRMERFRRILAEHMPALETAYHVQWLGLFGSYVREEQNPRSDLDVLVAFSQTPSLLEFVSLENHLSHLLGIKVDLVLRDALKRHLGSRILEEVVAV